MFVCVCVCVCECRVRNSYTQPRTACPNRTPQATRRTASHQHTPFIRYVYAYLRMRIYICLSTYVYLRMRIYVRVSQNKSSPSECCMHLALVACTAWPYGVSLRGGAARASSLQCTNVWRCVCTGLLCECPVCVLCRALQLTTTGLDQAFKEYFSSLNQLVIANYSDVSLSNPAFKYIWVRVVIHTRARAHTHTQTHTQAKCRPKRHTAPKRTYLHDSCFCMPSVCYAYEWCVYTWVMHVHACVCVCLCLCVYAYRRWAVVTSPAVL